MDKKYLVVLGVFVVAVVLAAGYFVYSLSSGNGSPITTTSQITTIPIQNTSTSLTPECASTGNCTVPACPSGSSINQSSGKCLWNFSTYQGGVSSKQVCNSGFCINSPVVLNSGIRQNLTFTVQDAEVLDGGAHINGTCGTVGFLMSNTVVANSGAVEINLSYSVLNPYYSPQNLNCTATVHSTKSSYDQSLQFNAVVTQSCPPGAVQRNNATCQATSPTSCADGFWYSYSTGLCEPLALSCIGGYYINAQTPGLCVVANACPSGYDFVLNNPEPLCTKS